MGPYLLSGVPCLLATVIGCLIDGLDSTSLYLGIGAIFGLTLHALAVQVIDA